MLRQKIRNFRAMHHYFLADHFNKYVTPKLLCISHIQMTDKSAKRTLKTQELLLMDCFNTQVNFLIIFLVL